VGIALERATDRFLDLRSSSPARKMLARGTKDKEHAMSQKLKSENCRYRHRFGKNSFHIVGQGFCHSVRRCGGGVAALAKPDV
jgi:hypothetical protein